MPHTTNLWSLLIYKIPTHPTRLRLKIWRAMQGMGAVYLQDGVCLLPSRPDLDENMQYVADSIQGMGGTSHLFSATAVLPEGAQRLQHEFRSQTDGRLNEIAERLAVLQTAFETANIAIDTERVEEEVKRERVAYLRIRRLAYFGSTRETDVDNRLENLQRALEEMNRSDK